MPAPRVTLIAAVSEDGFISRGQGVPWDLLADRAHFRAHTAGQWLLLGKTTYLEMLGWFRDHHPLVLSRDEQFTPAIGQRVRSVAEAIQQATEGGATELFVCGGSQAYALAMPYATRLLITQVATSLEQGAPFPKIDPQQWQNVSREDHPADQNHAYTFRFLTYQRTSGTACEP